MAGQARSLPLVGGLLLLAACRSEVPGPGPGCDDPGRVNDTAEELLECTSAQGAKTHLDALDEIGRQNGGNRAAGTAGYDASVDYVAAQAEAAGLIVTRIPFDIFDFAVLSPPEVEQLTPRPAVLTEGQDFLIASFSASGDVTAAVTAVDLQLGLGNATTSACEPEDFAGFPAGNIALVQRGTCSFTAKVINAQAAGAVGVVMMNQGNTPERRGVFTPFLSRDGSVTVPVFGASTAVGEALDADTADGLTMRLLADTDLIATPSTNVIAETPGGRGDNVVMLGAHLDSVQAGPGINDNGSGSASLLEIASRLKGVTPENKLRFAWWGGEELGLLGSFAFVDSRTPEELDDIALYLNFDMVASPNFVRAIYDGDGDAFGQVGPAGSDVIEGVFEAFFDGRGLTREATAFDGRSDYLPFILADIPSGGLFTGADSIKSAAEAELFGGDAGQFLDACYHSDCDDAVNIDLEVFEEMVDAIALSALTFAESTEAVSGAAKRARRARPAAVRPAAGCHGDDR
jgi:Zn-dependent M28 family amino/carboxypeptidase